MKVSAIILSIALLLAACAGPRDERMGQGVLIGGAGGALIGGAATGTAEGAIIGGVAGAAVGAVAADLTRPRTRTRCTYSEYYHRRICRRR